MSEVKKIDPESRDYDLKDIQRIFPYHGCISGICSVDDREPFCGRWR